MFVDGVSGAWDTGVTYSRVAASGGQAVLFKYSANHNVYQLGSAAAFEACNFTGATEIGNTTQGGGSGSYPNHFSYTCTQSGSVYLACQVGSHCAGGQKVVVACGSMAPTSATTSGTGRLARTWVGSAAVLAAVVLAGAASGAS